MTVRVGQLWKDNDKRVHRIVKILGVGPMRSRGMALAVGVGRVLIISVDKPGMSPVTTKITRFGLKGSAGFTLVKDVP